MSTRNGRRPERAASPLVAALERCWGRVREVHPEVPEAVLIVASGAGKDGGVEKWGHFADHRWHVNEQARHEVLIGGEGLRRGPAGVLGTLVHEAAHGLATARGVEDTSRQGRYHNKRFLEVAREVGLEVANMPPYGWARTELGAEAMRRYGACLRELERELVLWRREEPVRRRAAGTSGGRRQLWVCGCEPPRKLRIAASTAAAGPIYCGVCDQEFTEDVDEEDDEA